MGIEMSSMSGIDEQNRDVDSCGCKRFQYWTICDDRIRIIGYMHSNSCMKKHHVKAVVRWMVAKGLSKEDFIERIASFHCHVCGRAVKKGCDMFKRLHHNVISRWDMEHVWN